MRASLHSLIDGEAVAFRPEGTSPLVAGVYCVLFSDALVAEGRSVRLDKNEKLCRFKYRNP